MKSNTVFKAVFTLTAFSMIDRLLGFFFKVYLARSLGEAAMGVYNVSLSMFFVLITLTTSGLPLVISKFTAEMNIKKNRNREHGLVSAGLIIGAISSLVVCAVFYIFRSVIGNIFATKQSMTLLLLMLPGVMCTGVYASFRGNLWGHGRYKTVAVVELFEQITRITICLLLFLTKFDRLDIAAASLSASNAFSMAALIICYFAFKGRLKNPRGCFKPVIIKSLPITMIRASNTIVSSLVGLAVPFLLMRAGASAYEAMRVYGASVGMAFPMLFIPITIVGSLAYVMIPTLSSTVARGEMQSARRQIETSISFAIAVAAVFVPLFMSLGEEIGVVLYASKESGLFLQRSAWLLIPLSVENITSSMMNSLDLERHSFFNYLIGAALMFALMFCFYNKFFIELLIIAQGISLSVSSILDIRSIKKKTGIKLTFIPTLLKSAALVFPAAFLTDALASLFSFMPSILTLVLAGVIGFLFMLVLLMLFGVFDFSAFINRKKTLKPKKSRMLKKRSQAAHIN